jgi:hypothetical protein
MKFSNRSLSISLADKLVSSSFFTKKPFVIFYQENFVDSKIYDRFALDVDNFVKNNVLIKANKNSKKKIKIESLSSLSKYEITKSSLINDFAKILYSKKFYNWFKETHLPFYGQGIFGSILIKNKFQKFLFKAINFFGRKIFKKKFFSTHFLTIEFSDMEKGDYLTPHTDSFSKRMALVFYVPPPSVDIDIEKEKNWGTVFWGAKNINKVISSWSTNHQTEDKINSFLETNKVAVKVPYKPNSVNGFIKNDISWHSVDKNTSSDPRRAIVINIFEYNSAKDDIKVMNTLQEKVYKSLK